MICRLTGRVAAVQEDAVVLDLNGVGYEVMVPASAVGALDGLLGREVTLLTVQYFEGNPAGAHMIPRLIGFLSESDRAFYQLITKVKGISSRRALRVMSLPTPQLLAAIERGDQRLLTSLPEVGRKTAVEIITQLQGKLGTVQAASPPAAPLAALSEAQRIAVDILVQWGDRRLDAQRWVAAAVEAEPQLDEPDAIVRAAYRAKARSQG